MKLKFSFKKLLSIGLIAFFIGAVIIFGIGFNLFLRWPWEIYTWIIVGAYLVFCIALIIVSNHLNYYVFEDKILVVRRFRKEIDIEYKNIAYIDVEKSKKKKMLHLVTFQGKVLYFPFDNKGIVLDELLKRCHNLLSREDFLRKFPNLYL